MKSHYLDYAAATPLDKRVFAVMQPYFEEHFYNPSASYQAGRSQKQVIDTARHELAKCIGAKPSEIILTAGATESINLAIHGVMRHYGGNIVTVRTEHQAVLGAAKHYTPQYVETDLTGIVPLENLRKTINDETTLLSIGYANNELGTVQSLKDISQIIQDLREDRRARGIVRPLYFHTDASQAAGLLDISVSRLGIDMMSLNAGKCYGPKQVGLLWIRSEIILSPLIDGGGQERGLRSGTENVAGIVGFAKALALAQKERKEESYRLQNMRDTLQTRLTDELSGIIINGHKKKRLPHYLHFSLPDLDGERAVYALDGRGIMVATGSACAANKGTRSHVLSAVGMDEDMADGSIRISIGKGTHAENIDEIGTIIVETLKKERGL